MLAHEKQHIASLSAERKHVYDFVYMYFIPINMPVVLSNIQCAYAVHRQKIRSVA